MIIIFVITVIYFFVSSYLIYLSRNQINPDGIALIQIARHYAAGNFDLAVNSYWGPLLSWFIIPCVWLDLNPQLSVKILNIFFGLGFALGCVSLVKSMTLNVLTKHQSLLVFSAGLALVVNMISELVTADVLFTSILTWYFASSIKIINRSSKIFPFVSGVLGGLAFLTKSFAFPFITVHLLITVIFRKIAIRQKVIAGSILMPLMLSFAGFIIVILPWITIISLHDNTFTFGSSGRLTSSFIREKSDTGTFESIHQLFNVREGRITIWENPVEIPKARLFKISESITQSLKYHIDVVRLNISIALDVIKKIDLLGFYISGFVLTIFMLPLLKKITLYYLSLSWGYISVSFFISIYILIYIEQRYFWPIQGLLLAIAVHIISLLYSSDKTKSIVGYFIYDGTKNKNQLFISVFIALIILSTGWQTINIAYKWRDPDGLANRTNLLWQLASKARVNKQIVSNQWYEGLYLSFWCKAKYLGKFSGSTPESIAAELTPLRGATSVIIFYDEYLSSLLSQNSNFTLIQTLEFPPSLVSIFRFNKI